MKVIISGQEIETDNVLHTSHFNSPTLSQIAIHMKDGSMVVVDEDYDKVMAKLRPDLAAGAPA